MLKISDLKKDFRAFKNDSLGILLFGSHALGEETRVSDVDVCFVRPVNEEVVEEVNKSLGGKYDLAVYEAKY